MTETDDKYHAVEHTAAWLRDFYVRRNDGVFVSVPAALVEKAAWLLDDKDAMRTVTI